MDSNSLYAFEKFGDTVFRAVFNSVGNYAEAEDITQEVFLKFHQNPQNFNDENHMKAWLLRVAFNKCRDFRKSFRFRKQCSFDDVNENMLCVEFTSDEKSLLAEISSLPEKYSSVIYLYYYEKYSVKEIAEILKKNENTVSSLLRRARNKLKDILGEEWIGDFSELGYNFCFFDITDDERHKLSELFSSYKWVETDDNSWSIHKKGEKYCEFQFYMYGGENNRFIEFFEKGFAVYGYQNATESLYKEKAYKIDYNYLKDEIYKILNIREIKNFAVLDDTDEVAEITCNGVLLEGKEKEALIEWLAISVSDFAEVINVPDLSTANITKEIEYSDLNGINHKITSYDSGYVEPVDTKRKTWYNKNMIITKEQYARIEKYFPVQRGNVKIDNYTFINAILYIAENGCKWRALPEKYGKWNSIYQRFKRWCENGVIQRIFNALQQEKIIAVKVEILALDSTSCKVHPDAHGALKKEENNPSENQKAAGIPSFTWYPQMTRSLSKCICPEETVMTHRREEYPSNK